MNFPTLDPTWTTGLLTLDPGDVLSPDGRAHTLTALTPIGWTPAPQTGSTGAAGGSAAASTPAEQASFLHLPKVLNPANLLPAHLGARVAVGLVAIIVLGIIAWRLTT